MLGACLADIERPAVVLGLPRGGVPVAARVAQALKAPLDVIVVGKLGLPGQPELAMGAVAGVRGGVETIRNEAVLAQVAITEEDFARVHRRVVTEVQAREASYRGAREMEPLQERVVLVIDDGLATGSTMRAAVAAVARQQPARIVVAVPVAPRDTCVALRAASAVDELVCAWIPQRFLAVGDAYLDFTATSDEQVRGLLAGG